MTTSLAKQVIEGEIVEHWSKRLTITINFVASPELTESMALAKESLRRLPPLTREVIPMLDGNLDDGAIDL